MGASSVSEAVEAILADIVENKSGGATTLALRGLDALEALSDDLPAEKDPAFELITALVARIDALRPSVVAIGVQATLALARAHGLSAQGLMPTAALQRAIRVERDTLGQANLTISNLARRELGSGGVFASCSWSVTAARCLIAIKPERVIVGEGHRLGDGIKSAGWLAARGLGVELVPDGALPSAVAQARAVLVGADQVLSDGSVVNRCATFPLALAARHFRIPFMVACQRIKLGGGTSAPNEGAFDLLGELPEGVRGRAPLFDVTPAVLIRNVITESGVLSASEAGEIGSRIAGLRARFLSGD